MSRYKGRRSLKSIERDYPHIVDLPVPEGGFGAQDYISWCFADPQTAADFIREFGGVRRG